MVASREAGLAVLITVCIFFLLIAVSDALSADDIDIVSPASGVWLKEGILNVSFNISGDNETYVCVVEQGLAGNENGDTVASNSDVNNETLTSLINYTIDESASANNTWWKLICTGETTIIMPQRYMTMDTTNVSMSIASPENASWSASNSVSLTFTPDDNLAENVNCSYTLDGSTTNIGFMPDETANTSTMGGLTNWTHVVNVSCLDHAGNMNISENVHFFVDTEEPVVMISDGSPTQGSWYNSTTNPVNITFNATDSFSDITNCTIAFRRQVSASTWTLSSTQYLSSLTNNTNNLTSFGVSTDGNYSVNVTCSDRAGNDGDAATDFGADVNVPNALIQSPADGYNTTTGNLTITLVLTGETYPGSNFTLIRTLNGTNTTIWTGYNSSQIYYDDFTVTEEARYYLNYTCIDRVKNENTSATLLFMYDATAPTITLHTPANSSIINSTSADFNFSFVDNLVQAMACEVFVDGVSAGNNASVMNNTATVINASNLVNHNREWQVNCTDFDEGNVGGSAIWNISFLYNTSIVLWENPLGAQDANSTIYFYVNYTLPGSATQLNTSTPVCNITIYNNTNASAPISVVSNMEMAPSTYFNYSWNSSYEGDFLWNASCIRDGYVNRSGGRAYQITTLADLEISNNDAPSSFYSEADRNIILTITNIGKQDATSINISCYKNNTLFDSDVIGSLAANGGSDQVICSWDSNDDGGKGFVLNVTIDPENTINESTRENNQLLADINVTQSTALGAWTNSTGEETFVWLFASYNQTLNGVSDTALTSSGGATCSLNYTVSGGASNVTPMEYDGTNDLFFNGTDYGAGKSITWAITCIKEYYQTQAANGTFYTAAAPTISDFTLYGMLNVEAITGSRNPWWNVENITANATVGIVTGSIDTVWLNITRLNISNSALTDDSSILYMENTSTKYYKYTSALSSNNTYYNISIFVNDTLGQVVSDSKQVLSEARGPEVTVPALLNVQKNYNISINFTARSSYNITGVTLLMWGADESPSGAHWLNATLNKTSADPSNYSVAYSFNLTNISAVGDYFINITATDIRENSTISSTGYLEVWELAQMNGTVYTATNFTFFRPGTQTILLSSNNSAGAYNISIHNRTYDMLVKIPNSEVILTNLSLTGDLVDKFEINYLDANDTQIRIPMAPANRGHQGFYVKTINVTYAAANITLSYPTETGMTRIYKCSAWNDTHNCTTAAEWSDVSGTDAGDLVFDTTNKKVTLAVESFSAYVSGETSCGDGSCQSAWGETASTCDVDCSTGGGSSGGGGGGGGSSSVSTVADEEEDDEPVVIEQAPSEQLIVGTHSIKIELYQGEEGTISLRVQNPTDSVKKLSISASPNIRDMLEFDPATLSLTPKSISYFNIRVKPGLFSEVKSYFGELVVTDGDITDRASINIIILESLEKMLDIEISPLAEVINPGERLEIEVNLYVLGDVEKLYTRIVLQLIEQDIREVVVQTEKNILVQRSYSDVAAMNISEDMELGRYLVKGIATYTDSNNVTKEVVDLAYVTVDQPFLLRSVFGMPIWAIILGVIMMIVGGVVVFLYEQKKLKERRYIEKVDFAQLPQPSESAAFIGKLAESDIRAFMDIEKLKVHTLVAGATGSGKTIAAQVLVEEALKKGVSVVVFDPTAQWTGFLRPNKNETLFKLYPDFDMKRSDAAAFKGNLHIVESEHEEINFAKYLKTGGTITAFCMNRLTPHQIDVFVTNSIKTVFKADLDESSKLRLLIVYDEIHRLLPKFGGTGEGFIQVERACREFRKWGIGMVMISQVLSDFKGEIKANIGTEIQMRTRYEDDLERIKLKYGEDMQKSVLKASLGTGMLQNATYNRGRPYFVTFRPIFHNLHRLTNEELSLYKKYNKQINELRSRLADLKKEGVDIFDVELELNLAQSRLERGAFNIVDIYIESIKTRVDKHKPGDKVI